MESARRTLRDAEVRDLVRRVLQEQREKRALRWSMAILWLLAAFLGWLTFTDSGQWVIDWMDAL